MKLSDYVVEFLVSERITHVFEVCGGMITHLLDSLHQRKDISTISMHHEQAAAFTAEGYSRISGNPGVALATSGPGATNLITGIASCFFDSTPCLFITGQVNTYEFKSGRPVRQAGFQETDIVNIVKPIVKEAVLIRNPAKIKYYLERAFYIAKSGRPGPVLLDIPMDIQRAEINPTVLKSFSADGKTAKRCASDNKVMKQVLELMRSASRPVLLLGGGARISKAQDEILKFAHKTQMPVVASLMGLDSFPHGNYLFAGMIGTYGNRCANLTIANADLILALGTRFDTRQTGTSPETFARGAKIIHVDIDSSELNNKIKAAVPVCSDVREFLSILSKQLVSYDVDRTESWRQRIKSYKEKYRMSAISTGDLIHPNLFMERLSAYLPKDSVICVDVGQNQMWSAQTLEIGRLQRFITQGGIGAMGSALPLAIGASFARTGKIIVAITGDGGFQLNSQELQTIYHHKLPVKIILLNNHCYGMVRQFQEQYFKSRFQSTVIGYNAPNFQEVVKAYKIPAAKISSKKGVERALKKLFGDKKPAFLEIDVDQRILVLPKLSVNKPIEEQEPLLSPRELRANMYIDVLSEGANHEKRKKS